MRGLHFQADTSAAKEGNLLKPHSHEGLVKVAAYPPLRRDTSELLRIHQLVLTGIQERKFHTPLWQAGPEFKNLTVEEFLSSTPATQALSHR